MSYPTTSLECRACGASFEYDTEDLETLTRPPICENCEREDRIRERQLEITRIIFRLKTDDLSRVLSAMGHPGYGPSFARAILNAWKHGDSDLHTTISTYEREQRDLDAMELAASKRLDF